MVSFVLEVDIGGNAAKHLFPLRQTVAVEIGVGLHFVLIFGAQVRLIGGSVSLRPDAHIVAAAVAGEEVQAGVADSAGAQNTLHFLQDGVRVGQMLEDGERVDEIEGVVGESGLRGVHLIVDDIGQAIDLELAAEFALGFVIEAEHFASDRFDGSGRAVLFEHGSEGFEVKAMRNYVEVNGGHAVSESEIGGFSETLSWPEPSRVMPVCRARRSSQVFI